MWAYHLGHGVRVKVTGARHSFSATWVARVWTHKAWPQVLFPTKPYCGPTVQVFIISKVDNTWNTDLKIQVGYQDYPPALLLLDEAHELKKAMSPKPLDRTLSLVFWVTRMTKLFEQSLSLQMNISCPEQRGGGAFSVSWNRHTAGTSVTKGGQDSRGPFCKPQTERASGSRSPAQVPKALYFTFHLKSGHLREPGNQAPHAFVSA